MVAGVSYSFSSALSPPGLSCVNEPSHSRLAALFSWSPHEPRAVEGALAAGDDALGGGPGGAGEALARDVAVDADVVDEGVEAAVVLLVAHEAEDQQAHGGVVEVGAEGVQHVHLGGAHAILVEGVVADRHDHGVDLESRRRRCGGRCRGCWYGCGCRGGGSGGGVWMGGRQRERGPAEVHAGSRGGDPGRRGGVDGQVRGRDAELLGAAPEAGDDGALHAQGEGRLGAGIRVEDARARVCGLCHLVLCCAIVVAVVVTVTVAATTTVTVTAAGWQGLKRRGVVGEMGED